jgi:hypothetical protein
MTTPDDASENVKPTPEASAFSWKDFGTRLMQIGKTALTTAESIKTLEKENERLQTSLKELTKEVINLRIAVAENKTRLDLPSISSGARSRVEEAAGTIASA